MSSQPNPVSSFVPASGARKRPRDLASLKMLQRKRRAMSSANLTSLDDVSDDRSGITRTGDRGSHSQDAGLALYAPSNTVRSHRPSSSSSISTTTSAAAFSALRRSHSQTEPPLEDPFSPFAAETTFLPPSGSRVSKSPFPSFKLGGGDKSSSTRSSDHFVHTGSLKRSSFQSFTAKSSSQRTGKENVLHQPEQPSSSTHVPTVFHPPPTSTTLPSTLAGAQRPFSSTDVTEDPLKSGVTSFHGVLASLRRATGASNASYSSSSPNTASDSNPPVKSFATLSSRTNMAKIAASTNPSSSAVFVPRHSANSLASLPFTPDRSGTSTSFTSRPLRRPTNPFYYSPQQPPPIRPPSHSRDPFALLSSITTAEPVATTQCTSVSPNEDQQKSENVLGRRLAALVADVGTVPSASRTAFSTQPDSSTSTSTTSHPPRHSHIPIVSTPRAVGRRRTLVAGLPASPSSPVFIGSSPGGGNDDATGSDGESAADGTEEADEWGMEHLEVEVEATSRDFPDSACTVEVPKPAKGSLVDVLRRHNPASLPSPSASPFPQHLLSAVPPAPLYLSSPTAPLIPHLVSRVVVSSSRPIAHLFAQSGGTKAGYETILSHTRAVAVGPGTCLDASSTPSNTAQPNGPAVPSITIPSLLHHYRHQAQLPFPSIPLFQRAFSLARHPERPASTGLSPEESAALRHWTTMERDWRDAWSSAVGGVRHGMADECYYLNGEFGVVVRGGWVQGEKRVKGESEMSLEVEAVVGRSSRGLRAAMRREGIPFHPLGPLDANELEEDTQCVPALDGSKVDDDGLQKGKWDIDGEEDEEIVNLGVEGDIDKGVIVGVMGKRKPRNNRTPATPSLLISGHQAVHSLFDFLLTWRDPNLDRRAAAGTPRISCAHPFLNASLHRVRTEDLGRRATRDGASVWSVALGETSGGGGWIPPDMLRRVMDVLAKEVSDFEVEVVGQEALGEGLVETRGKIGTLEGVTIVNKEVRTIKFEESEFRWSIW
ncbi:hypothetical protein HDU93_009903 [Gonapodya sp. JEL0774]|nr:hypothetical protein HDU93_009903 [Gonapodya sp. JEL0774]